MGLPCTPKAGQHPFHPHSTLKPEMRLTSPDAAPLDLPWQFWAITGVKQGRALNVQLI